MNINFHPSSSGEYQLFPCEESSTETNPNEASTLEPTVSYQHGILARNVTGQALQTNYIPSCNEGTHAEIHGNSSVMHSEESKAKLKEMIEEKKRLTGVILSYEDSLKSGTISFYVLRETYVACFLYAEVENYKSPKFERSRTPSKELKAGMSVFFNAKYTSSESDHLNLRACTISIGPQTLWC